MTSKTPRILLIIIAVLAIAALAVWKSRPHSAVQDSDTLTYNSAADSFSFEYPAKLSATESAGKATVAHSIAYRNSFCDFRGDQPEKERMDDFSATLYVVNGNVRTASLAESPYIPAEDLTADSLKVIPGFIDEARFGDLEGFATYEGAEGCGRMTYYFPLAPSKTLVVVRPLPFVYSGVASAEAKDAVAQVPGVIPAAEGDRIFSDILKSFSWK